jgi:hypothetical protein
VSKAAMGAKVHYCGHDGTFTADIYRIGNVNVVKANGPVSGHNIERPAVDATHHLSDFPLAGFWRPEIGVFVVPQTQVTVLKGKVSCAKKSRPTRSHLTA